MTAPHPPSEHARVTFEGSTYVVGCLPENWAMLHLPAAHEWARSVRWSCGRPGFEIPTDLFAEASWRSTQEMWLREMVISYPMVYGLSFRGVTGT